VVPVVCSAPILVDQTVDQSRALLAQFLPRDWIGLLVGPVNQVPHHIQNTKVIRRCGRRSVIGLQILEFCRNALNKRCILAHSKHIWITVVKRCHHIRCQSRKISTKMVKINCDQIIQQIWNRPMQKTIKCVKYRFHGSVHCIYLVAKLISRLLCVA